VNKKPEQAQKKISDGRGHILLVDDEEMILDVGSRMLRKLNYQVTTAGSGGQAIELYQAGWQSFDLVILDMIMPDMGGAKLYGKLKQINPDIKALLSSGYSVNEQTSQILEQGCNGFIQKPFGLKELSMKLGSLDF
jgi:CheY-like chemotaxis protein